MRFYLITDKNEIREDGFQFKDGLNVDSTFVNKDTLPRYTTLCPGGIVLVSDIYHNEDYYRKYKQLIPGEILEWIDKSTHWIREATVPKDSQQYVHWSTPPTIPDYWKFDKVILGKREPINCQLIKKLFDRGARLGQSGWKQIIFALERKQYDTFEYLMHHGAAFNTGLYYAIEYGYLDGVKLIVDEIYPGYINKWQKNWDEGKFYSQEREWLIDQRIEYSNGYKKALDLGFVDIANCIKKHIHWNN